MVCANHSNGRWPRVGHTINMPATKTSLRAQAAVSTAHVQLLRDMSEGKHQQLDRSMRVLVTAKLATKVEQVNRAASVYAMTPAGRALINA